MPSISLCVIARDEEATLPACLASVAGSVNELIVVDTGSRDRTAALASAAGAKVITYAWRDDFADARNTALAAASGDFILVLDADEQLAAGAGPALRAAAEDPSCDAGFLTLYNARSTGCSIEAVLNSAAARYDEPTLLPRLLRRLPDLRWEGCVHENVTRWLNARPQALKRVEAAIVHYGYTPEIGEPRAKKQRNFALLERWCEREPDDVMAWTYFAWELRTAADAALVVRAASAAERGWNALQRMAAGLSAAAIKTQLPTPVPLATVRAWRQLDENQLDAARATLDQAEAWGATHPNLTLLRALLAERVASAPDLPEPARRAAHDRAIEAYASCLAQRDRTFTEWLLDGATGWFAATGLGTRLLERDAAAALQAFDSALTIRSDYVPALLGRADALLGLRRPHEALTLLGPLLENAAVRAHADAWLLAGLASEQVGAGADASVFVQHAEQRLASGGTLQSFRMPQLHALRARLAAPAARAKQHKPRGRRR